MKIISLFCGAGGMDLGFARAGHQIVWANDVWHDAVQTYRLNFGDHVHLGPIDAVSPVPDADVVIGGFPCQGFSIANRGRNESDSRNQLYLELLRVIAEKRPRFFVAENVKGILSLAGGRVFEQILLDFENVGYRVNHALLNAADYGVPQRRERVFLVGRRLDEGLIPSFPPPKTHAHPKDAERLGLLPWVSVGAALSVLPEPGPLSGVPNHDDFSNYKLRFNGHLGHRRVDENLPAPTITARGDDRGGVVVIHHPSNSRRISPREAATIQSFPETFEFSGTRTSAYRQIANAVPPRLAYAVASCLPTGATGPRRQEEVIGAGPRAISRIARRP